MQLLATLALGVLLAALVGRALAGATQGPCLFNYGTNEFSGSEPQLLCDDFTGCEGWDCCGQQKQRFLCPGPMCNYFGCGSGGDHFCCANEPGQPGTVLADGCDDRGKRPCACNGNLVEEMSHDHALVDIGTSKDTTEATSYADCQYFMTGQAGSVFRVTLVGLSVSNTAECVGDFVAILAHKGAMVNTDTVGGFSSDAKGLVEVKRFCGTTTNQVVHIAENAMALFFHTQGSTQRSFSAQIELLDCGGLDDPPNGKVSMAESERQAKIKCNQGFELKSPYLDNRDTVECLTGVWTPMPSCVLPCTTPPPVANGKIIAGNTGTVFLPGHLVTYECDADATMVGSKDVKCLDSGNWGKLPECFKPCGQLPLLKHGSIKYVGNPARTATLTCLPGYSLVGNSEVGCVGGHWEVTNAVCQGVMCDILIAPPGATTVIVDNQGRYPTTATVECEAGNAVRLGKASTLDCQPDGGWDPQAFGPCEKIITCPELSAAFTVTNNHVYPSSATLACPAGFYPSPKAETQCTLEGEWDGIPECRALSTTSATTTSATSTTTTTATTTTTSATTTTTSSATSTTTTTSSTSTSTTTTSVTTTTTTATTTTSSSTSTTSSSATTQTSVNSPSQGSSAGSSVAVVAGAAGASALLLLVVVALLLRKRSKKVDTGSTVFTARGSTRGRAVFAPFMHGNPAFEGAVFDYETPNITSDGYQVPVPGVQPRYEVPLETGGTGIATPAAAAPSYEYEYSTATTTKGNDDRLYEYEAPATMRHAYEYGPAIAPDNSYEYADAVRLKQQQQAQYEQPVPQGQQQQQQQNYAVPLGGAAAQYVQVLGSSSGDNGLVPADYSQPAEGRALYDGGKYFAVAQAAGGSAGAIYAVPAATRATSPPSTTPAPDNAYEYEYEQDSQESHDYEYDAGETVL